jgi:hypothetical protein
MPIFYNTDIIGREGPFIIKKLVMTFPRAEKNTELFSVFVVINGGERHVKDFHYEHSAKLCIQMEARREKQWRM